jgi:coproporphyrinogen III oxidase
MLTFKPSPMLDQMHNLVTEIQSNICTALETLDSKKFHADTWQRPGGGGGTTRVLEEGSVIEKGGVNVSKVYGDLSGQEIDMFKTLIARVAPEMGDHLSHASFGATGVSLVIHPLNPNVPTTHANYRYFELNTEKDHLWWFGGGADLTPYYLNDADAIHFHQKHKEACDTLSQTAYQAFKQECDQYFYLPHRGETRGVGGIFFDYLRQESKETYFQFAKTCGQAFIDAYVPIVSKNMDMSFTQQQRDWQLYRRGRYVEFNLLYDRGTLFGIKTKGRTESILMSLPNIVSWKYNYHPEAGSAEEKLTQCLQNPQKWV